MADTSKMRFLKRFPEDKHAQVLQVMSYLEMCGLTGRDLVSIGGYVDRRLMNERYQSAKARVQDYIDQKTISPIGADNQDRVESRFKYKGINGTYNFDSDGWSYWSATSVKTKVKKRFPTSSRDWPSHVPWSKRHFLEVVLDIAEGNIKLDF